MPYLLVNLSIIIFLFIFHFSNCYDLRHLKIHNKQIRPIVLNTRYYNIKAFQSVNLKKYFCNRELIIILVFLSATRV